MKLGLWLAAAAIAFVPAVASSAVVQFATPAGNLAAGHLHNAPFDAVLPSGRIVTPAGQSVVTGMGALGFTLTPDGRFAVVSNADQRYARVASALDPSVLGGDSLTVVDTATLRVVDRFALAGETYAGGVVAVADPRLPARTLIFAAGGTSASVYALDIDTNGHLTPDAQHTVAVGEPVGSPAADGEPRVPVALVPSADGRRVYVVDERGDGVAAIDTAQRAVASTSGPVGFRPFGAALAGDELLVSNEGLMRAQPAASAQLAPAFSVPPADTSRASSLSFVPLGPAGALATPSRDVPGVSIALDGPPDGLRIVGGAHPTAIAVRSDAAFAFIAMTNVDRIATVRLGAAPVVVGGTELRLFDRGPYGTQPDALALSRDGTRLYVALAGLNAVAVLDARDPVHLHRLGLIPTGWFPTTLALSPDDRSLFVVNTKGFGHDIGFAGDPRNGADSGAVWSTLQKIDLPSLALAAATYKALKNTRAIHSSAPKYPRAVRNVVVIVTANAPFDAVLGDCACGPADPQYTRFGQAVTPNLHALARRYGVAANVFADAAEPDVADQFLAAGLATAFAQRTAARNGAPAGANETPDGYPRAGYLAHNLARHTISFRDYGDLVRVRGYDDGEAADPASDDPAYVGPDDRSAPTHGLGGRYASTTPAPAVFSGHIDLDYPGWNARIRNERRAREFIRDYSQLVQTHRQPRYTQIWLPAGHIARDSSALPSPEAVAQGDRALGLIVQYLSRLPAWKNTVVFVLGGGAVGGQDHVDENRTYALVISPFAKRHYVGLRHLSTVSILKTSEQLLHVPPLSLGDLLATDLSDFFTPLADAGPYTAVDVPVASEQQPVDSGVPAP